jgi:hypothetical protein
MQPAKTLEGSGFGDRASARKPEPHVQVARMGKIWIVVACSLLSGRVDDGRACFDHISSAS